MTDATERRDPVAVPSAPDDDPRAEIERYVEAHGALAAVEWVTERNRRQADPRLERRLVELRHQAFSELDLSAARSSWPPSYPDLFEGVEGGLVEVAADELRAEHLGAGILHHGALLVRGLVTPSEVEELKTAIDLAFAAADARNSGTPLAQVATWYAPFSAWGDYSITLGERGWVRDGGGLWTADSPRAFWVLTEILGRSRLRSALTGYLGERPALSVNKGTLRRVPVDAGGEWHQDGAFLGHDIRTVNAWLSLTRCGVDAPGLDLVPRRIPEIVETGSGGAYFNWSVGPGTVEQVAGSTGVIRPIFEAGDALLFDERFLHRTAAEPAMAQERYAVESWFFAPSRYPKDQVPLVF